MPTLAELDAQKLWKEQPASPAQLIALRRLATNSGRTFSVGITQGQAWARIGRAYKQVPDPLRSECAPPWYEPVENR